MLPSSSTADARAWRSTSGYGYGLACAGASLSCRTTRWLLSSRTGRVACELLRFDQSERRWTALLLAATVRLAAALAVVSGRGLAERAWPWAHVWQVAGLVVADLRGGGGGAHLVPVQNA